MIVSSDPICIVVRFISGSTGASVESAARKAKLHHLGTKDPQTMTITHAEIVMLLQEQHEYSMIK